MASEPTFRIDNLGKDVLVLTGTVNAGNAIAFVNELTSRPYRLSQDLVLDMAELFFADGIAILITINTFRSLATRLNSLSLNYPSEPMIDGLEGNGILRDRSLNVRLLRQQVTESEAAE